MSKDKAAEVFERPVNTATKNKDNKYYVEAVSENEGESSMKNIIKQALSVIMVAADFILAEKNLSDLGRGRLKIIKRQVEIISKALRGEGNAARNS